MQNDKPGQPADAIPYALTIEGADFKDTWRALPGPATTIGELYLACVTFNLRCDVDDVGEIGLVPHSSHRGPVPDSAELVRVMWGLGAGDDDPTPDEEGEPATTWLENASKVPPR